MAVRKWHSGKLVILWAWGGVGAALAMTRFLSGATADSPLEHLLALVFTLLVLILLTVITWWWLGGRESN
jgi:heme/copper-type cytochrome/quinol oxidase subunit 4